MDRIDLTRLVEDEDFIEEFGLLNSEDFSLLGYGEYNINYIFQSERYSKKLVLRIATDSQMDLDNQIRYEFDSLKLLKDSGRTPEAIYCDDRMRLLPYGFLVMEYLPGNSLDYREDLVYAAEILADIHNQEINKKNHLISPKNPIKSIYKECISMFSKYKESDLMNLGTKNTIEELLDRGKNIGAEDIGRRTIINTELNSGNFLINKDGRSYLIDWEKPLFAYPSQDLGHFLAPTTTFWKTDSILSREEIFHFLEVYTSRSNQYKDPKKLWKSVSSYLAINCLRGISWCSMAYVEYQNPNKLISNEYTYEKIKKYLSDDFLLRIGEEYLNEYK